MSPRPHFWVRKHSPTQWSIVNAHMGHGLLFPTRAMALKIAKQMNRAMKEWLDDGVNTLPERLLDRAVSEHPANPGEDTGGGQD
jgi:hypothetical protein